MTRVTRPPRKKKTYQPNSKLIPNSIQFRGVHLVNVFLWKCWKISILPSGKLTWQLNITFYHLGNTSSNGPCSSIFGATRWAPTVTPTSGVTTPLITGRGPPCMLVYRSVSTIFNQPRPSLPHVFPPTAGANRFSRAHSFSAAAQVTGELETLLKPDRLESNFSSDSRRDRSSYTIL